MRPALLDTDTLSHFLRGNPAVRRRATAYAEQYGSVNLSLITYYEILSGLLHRDWKKQLESFRELVSRNTVVPVNMAAVDIAADCYASTRKAGTPVDDIDLLIAGVAMANDFVLATCNTRHFSMVPGLQIEDWTTAVEQDG